MLKLHVALHDKFTHNFKVI